MLVESGFTPFVVAVVVCPFRSEREWKRLTTDVESKYNFSKSLRNP